MIVMVKYGDTDSIVVNTDCSVYNLLKYIRLKCCPTEEAIDLSDEKGKLKNLRFRQSDYGKDHVTSRESLVLIAVRNSTTPEGGGGSEVEENQTATSVLKQTLVPLLTSKLTDLHFLAKLNEPRVKSVAVNEAITAQKMDTKHRRTASSSSSSSAATAASGGGGDKKSAKNAQLKNNRQTSKLAPKNNSKS